MTELKKANDRLLEAEKGKSHAEAENRTLMVKLREAREKLSSADEKLREAEIHKQMLRKEAQSHRDDAKEAQQQLLTARDKLCLNEESAKEKLQKAEGEREALESRVGSLQAELEMVRKDREDAVATLEQQLSDSRRQQQMMQEELERLQKDNEEKQLQEKYVGRMRCWCMVCVMLICGNMKPYNASTLAAMHFMGQSVSHAVYLHTITLNELLLLVLILRAYKHLTRYHTIQGTKYRNVHVCALSLNTAYVS